MTALTTHVTGDRYKVVGWDLADDEGDAFDTADYDAISVQVVGESVPFEGSLDATTWAPLETLPEGLTGLESPPRYVRPNGADALVTLYAVRWQDLAASADDTSGDVDRIALRMSRLEIEIWVS